MRTKKGIAKDLMNKFKEEVLQRNKQDIQSTVQRLLKEIEESATNGDSEIRWATLMRGEDSNVVRECNLEVCRLLEKEGFSIRRNHSLRDYCWDRREDVTIAWDN